jgi:[ribosomal protein S5]-alanine N-acetyltransferase
MTTIPPYEFVTPRLRLRAGEALDAETLFENYTSSREASKYLQRKPHASVKDTQSMLAAWGQKSWNADGRFAWVISADKNGEAIGLVLLITNGSNAEIHFGIAPPSWGRGLATEAVQAVMDWIAASSDINEVTAVCDHEHTASARVLSKSGFTRQDLIPDHLFLPSFGTNRNCRPFLWKRKAEKAAFVSC